MKYIRDILLWRPAGCIVWRMYQHVTDTFLFIVSLLIITFLSPGYWWGTGRLPEHDRHTDLLSGETVGGGLTAQTLLQCCGSSTGRTTILAMLSPSSSSSSSWPLGVRSSWMWSVSPVSPADTRHPDTRGHSGGVTPTLTLPVKLELELNFLSLSLAVTFLTNDAYLSSHLISSVPHLLLFRQVRRGPRYSVMLRQVTLN